MKMDICVVLSATTQLCPSKILIGDIANQKLVASYEKNLGMRQNSIMKKYIYKNVHFC